MRIRAALLLLALAGAGSALAQAPGGRAATGSALAQAPGGRAATGLASCGSEASADRVSAVSNEGDLALASGRIARLADLRWPDAPAIRSAGLAWLRERIGEAVEVRAGPPDRWNRLPARIALATEPQQNLATEPQQNRMTEPPRDLVRHLVGAGLAVVDPGEAERLCDRHLLALEAQARGDGRGLWATERPLRAEAVEELRRRVGTFVVVEGRVRSVGERERRTYLNFGRAWSEDFTVTIPKRSWAILTAGAVSAAALRGRRIRVRGLLEDWNGPALSLESPDALEILDAGGAAR